ncbi:spore-associated protein A [Streptomyces sp. NPDC091279]|uniref:spore-associated protein A n=1 Tax=unclassified Streptomyces TaxID=2593676 RepID=UPI0037FEFA38
MNLSRRTTTATALAVLALGGSLAATTSASAATTTAATTRATAKAPAPAATAVYNGACGTGYTVIDSTPVGNSGKTFLTWNQSTGKNCAVTIRNTTGAKISLSVRLEIAGKPATAVVDKGLYTSYAGPVYLAARGECISWSGTIGSATGGDTGHCG